MNTIDLEDKTFSCADVIELLREQVTPERLDRIEGVINNRNKNLITVMENIYDRGNTSAVMRSAEAFGFHNFHQVVEIDTFKESKRVTQGADKWLVQKHWETTQDCVTHLKDNGYKVYVTHLEGGKPIDKVSFAEPVALCFGSEKNGASPLLTELADERVYIPMQGFVQSFNISVAAALCFQHVHKEHKSLNLPSLSDIERQQLMALYLYRSCKAPNLSRLNPITTK